LDGSTLDLADTAENEAAFGRPVAVRAAAPGSRRQPRVRRLIETLVSLAKKRGIAVYTVARSAVLSCFSSADQPATKHSIAMKLAEQFPELQPSLPRLRPRKAYESEDDRMSIFDAVAFAVTHANS
jgi:hypothetical protein